MTMETSIFNFQISVLTADAIQKKNAGQLPFRPRALSRSSNIPGKHTGDLAVPKNKWECGRCKCQQTILEFHSVQTEPLMQIQTAKETHC